ncbi:MAG: SIS domain-containing protein [Firmicutes bacterium]|jgi:uncharacterized phosphosugar-binding protein|nr:SIS domain-containing protein [Bacillota bacterium]
MEEKGIMTQASRRYFDRVVEVLENIEKNEKESIDRAAKILANAISEDRLVNIIGPGGHSNIGVEETFWRAGGLAPVNAILDAGTNLIHGAKRSNYVERTCGYAKAVLDSYGIAEGDVLIIVNAYGINAMTIDCAFECKKRNVTSIGITSTGFADFVPKSSVSRHPSGESLYKIVDVFINNHMPLGDAVVEVPGTEQKMGPTSTFANCFTVNLLMIRTAERLWNMGAVPPIWMSANLPGGDEANKKYEGKYSPRIKHLR